MTEDSGYTQKDWQGHYDSDDLKWDLGKPAPPFIEFWEQTPPAPGEAIVPGCGRGHEVVFLLERGFRVTAVDYAAGAVERLRRSLDDKGLAADVLQHDFFELDASHDLRYDLMLEHTFFCAIHPSRRGQYVDTAARIVKPGGLLVALFYETGEEGGPPFNTPESEVRRHFSERFLIERLEKSLNSDERRKDKEWFALLRKT